MQIHKSANVRICKVAILSIQGSGGVVVSADRLSPAALSSLRLELLMRDNLSYELTFLVVTEVQLLLAAFFFFLVTLYHEFTQALIVGPTVYLYLTDTSTCLQNLSSMKLNRSCNVATAPC